MDGLEGIWASRSEALERVAAAVIDLQKQRPRSPRCSAPTAPACRLGLGSAQHPPDPRGIHQVDIAAVWR